MVYDLDRGDHPKNAGDRAYGHGDEITFELSVGTKSEVDLNEDDELPAGYFVDFDGAGGVARADQNDGSTDVAYGLGDDSTTDGTEASYDAVLKHSAEDGEQVTVHLRGAQRVAESQDVWPVVDEYADDGTGDKLIVLR